MIKKSVIISALIISLSACSFTSKEVNLASVDTANLQSLESVRVNPLIRAGKQTKLSALRIRSLKDSALSIGARGGLSWASNEIDVNLNKDTKYLDGVFNFNAMMLPHGVMPPVLEASGSSLNLSDPDTVRIADRSYRIIKQARFTTTPPNWREYLWLHYSKPELPDRTLLPKTDLEQKIWREGVKEGWEKGIEQAYSIFQQNLARLKRDFNGMVLYRKLLESKMIKAPYVSRTELGVTGNGTNMRINDQVLRIVEHPKLQTNTKKWKAIVIKERQWKKAS